MPSRTLLLGTMAVAAAWAAGCAGSLNREVQVGEAWTPPTLRDEPSLVARANTEDPNPGEPSAPTLDRTDWPWTTVNVPNELTTHQPRYTKPWLDNHRPDSPARASGGYPTALTALDVPGTRTEGAQVREAVVGPFAAACDVALWPFRAVMARPWQRTKTGLEPYQRAPHARVWTPTAAEAADEPPRAPMPPAEPMYPETGSPGGGGKP